MAKQPWENDPIIVPAGNAGARPAVEFDKPVAPMSPAEATRLGFEGTRLQMQQEADQRAIAEKERQRKELTDTQSKSLGFYQRMRSSDVQQAQLGLEPQGYAEMIAQQRLPLTSRSALSDERRSQLDAIENFIAASLRLESGAAIGPDEFQKQMRIFFPMPGAGPKEIEQKRQQRELAIRGFRTMAGEYGAEQADKNLTELGFLDEAGKPIMPEPTQGRIVTAPGTTSGTVMGAIQGGQPIMTAEDRQAGQAIQEAWNRTGRFADTQAVAAQYGRSFGQEEAAFLQANEGKPVTINVNPTGQPTAAEQSVGEFVATPMGETVAAGMTSSANAMTLGLLDELAPVLGLDADRVQAAKRYLQERNVGASLVGEMAGSIGPTGLISRGVNTALAGGRAAGLAPLAGDTIAGILAGAGESNENRLGGALLGGTLGGAGGALGRRVFGGTPPAGGAPVGGAPMGGPSAGMGGPMGTPPAGGAPMGGPMGGMGGAGQRVSAGAAATPMDVIRVSVGEGLPVPVRLMNFQKTRDFADGQRARELAKNNELGGPIRENLARQQQEMASNFDAFLDKTGAQIWQGREDRGIRVTNALEKMAAQDKARVRTLYNQAAKSADAQTKVPLNQFVPIQIGEDEIETTLLRYFTSQPTGVPSSGTVDAARQFAVNLGVLSKNEAGDLIAANPTVKNMEELRREISGIGNPADPNSIRQETILKRLIDAHTEPYATGAYALARAARKEVSDKYESVSTIAQLLGTKKRTPERVIAAEKVMDRLLSGITSAANLRSLKGLLTGADGDPQAWQEVQGALVEKIRTAAYPKGTTADEAGQKSISPAALRGVVQEMDESGKLDIVFEPEVARGMRDLADTAEYAFTAPPGSVNFSNTSSAWVNAFDMIINTGIAGVPLKGGLVNNVLIPLKNAAKNREAKKEVRRLVGDNAQ